MYGKWNLAFVNFDHILYIASFKQNFCVKCKLIRIKYSKIGENVNIFTTSVWVSIFQNCHKNYSYNSNINLNLFNIDKLD